MDGDRVGESQVLEAAPPDQVCLIVEVDRERVFIAITDHSQRAVENPLGPVIYEPNYRFAGLKPM